MDLLGKLGIDLKLLVAQIINFGLLLWILYKLLYKPVIEKIEKDEVALKKAEESQKRLDKEKDDLLKEKEQTLRDARIKAQEIVQEANQIAKGIRIKARAESQKQLEEAHRLSKKTENSKIDSFRKKIEKEMRRQGIKSIQSAVETVMGKGQSPDIEVQFFKKLVKEIQRISATEIRSHKIPFTLEYAHVLSQEQLTQIETLLAKKTGKTITLKLKKNKKLIVGYRIEIVGYRIESNLQEIIKEGLHYA